ncbi:response regulator [Mariniflexile ostreae]|uniref:Response regulator n=1 Tax=Mariniflexile ostreae TaxID=1520892 RepID=A0ABV5FF81_9FLAO
MNKINITCIIDDDPIYQHLINKMMIKTDFSKSYIFYKNGKEALKGIKQRLENNSTIPDVILLDINMPVMDGWQFLDEVAKINTYEHIKILVISSSIDPRDIEKAKKNKLVIDYVLKPISLSKIKHIQDTLLNKTLS